MTERNVTTFTKEMRISSRKEHRISDDFINAKLAFAMHNNDVWSEGLLVFYEVFKFLENHLSYDILPKEFRRTEAFEQDLSYFLGPHWQENYQPRKEVQNYLDHLVKITNTNSTLLVAYVYHMYLGLLSGGQILQKKRKLVQKIFPKPDDEVNAPGCAVTTYDVAIGDLKTQLKEIIDNLAKNWDENTKQAILEEGKKVFQLNNELVRSIKTNKETYKLLGYFLLFILTILFFYVMWNL
ncbi:heme oxygenase 2 [Culicoides brevitarsis]|uniref:heme oxygenase 2 n=1 Tax=Culicoides brevitarsis TaxID=469753 RepID=UPI00307C167F